jgi:hypothetical protein
VSERERPGANGGRAALASQPTCMRAASEDSQKTSLYVDRRSECRSARNVLNQLKPGGSRARKSIHNQVPEAVNGGHSHRTGEVTRSSFPVVGPLAA